MDIHVSSLHKAFRLSDRVLRIKMLFPLFDDPVHLGNLSSNKNSDYSVDPPGLGIGLGTRGLGTEDTYIHFGYRSLLSHVLI